MTSSSASASVHPSPMLEENLDGAGVLRFTLNRPNERNALSSALLDALLQAAPDEFLNRLRPEIEAWP